jgi:hypothetical protein
MWNPDVMLAVGGFVIQCALALLGLEMTHWKNRTIFGQLVLCGLIFTVVAVNRSVDFSNKQTSKLDKIDIQTQTNIHGVADFYSPVNVKEFPLLPFHVNQTPTINIAYHNSGNGQIREAVLDGMVLVVEFNEAPQVFRKYGSGLNPKGAAGTLNPHDPAYSYMSYTGAPLSADDVRGLMTREKAFCALGAVKWKDDTGNYETTFSQCLMRETGGGFNWHTTADNNVEHKLP